MRKTKVSMATHTYLIKSIQKGFVAMDFAIHSFFNTQKTILWRGSSLFFLINYFVNISNT